MSDLFDRVQQTADAIRGRLERSPTVGVLLGSGLGAFADGLDSPLVIPYAELPHFPLPSVAGHRGNLVVGRVGGWDVAVLQGRFHSYEGHDLETVTYPVRVLRALGVSTLVLTAATGGIGPSHGPGAIVCLSDHLNLIGSNPLRGPNDDRLGPRFPDMSEVYSPRLRRLARVEADRLGLPLTEGVYACLPGPSYETPAEIRMLRALGADVVGMSTVPEAIVARHGGMEVVAFAVVSNWAAGIASSPISHQEVLDAGQAAGPGLAALLVAVIERASLG